MAQQLSGIQMSTKGFDPEHEQVRVSFQAAEAGFATLVVFGPDGGWLLSLGEIRIHAGANTLAWSGRDSEGQPVESGEYTLELFGFDLTHRPAPAAALRAQVYIKISPGSESRRVAPDPPLYWLPRFTPAAYTSRLYSSG